MEAAPCCAAAFVVTITQAAATVFSIFLNFVSIGAHLRFSCQIGFIASRRNSGQNGLRQSAPRDRRSASV
jgi:hypothetical protein